MLLAQEYGRVLAPHSNFTMFYNVLQMFYKFLQIFTIFYNFLQFFYNFLQFFTIFYNFLQFFTIFYNFLQFFTKFLPNFYQILHFVMCNYYSTFIVVLQSLWSLHTAAFIGEDWQLKHNDDCVCFSSD